MFSCSLEMFLYTLLGLAMLGSIDIIAPFHGLLCNIESKYEGNLRGFIFIFVSVLICGHLSGLVCFGMLIFLDTMLTREWETGFPSQINWQDVLACAFQHAIRPGTSEIFQVRIALVTFNTMVL